ncbi:MAG: DUF1287 domain-containing protein [Candidatus Glassbacteria bacterium]
MKQFARDAAGKQPPWGKYPDGDVPDSIGVCTDFVIREHRAIGLDLQKEVFMRILY